MALPVIETSLKNDSAGNTATSLVLTKPSGVVSGDLLLIIVGSDHISAGEGWTTHTGFTRFVSSNNTTADAALACFQRISDGTEATSETMAHTSADELWGIYFRISGVNQTTPINVTGTPDIIAEDTSHPITEVTTTIDDCLAFYALSFDGGDGAGFTVAGTGWTEFDEQTSGTGANDASGCYGTKDQTTQGLTGTATVTSAVGDGSNAVQFAVAPTAPPAITLIAALATYSLVGIATTFTRTYILVAALDTYSLVGIAANLQKGFTVTADLATYSLVGIATNLNKGSTLIAALGTYSLAGIATTFTRTYILVAALDTYSLIGIATNLNKGSTITAALGTYSLVGIAVTFDRTYVLTADLSTYSLVGIVTNLNKGSTLTAALGTYALAGIAINLLWNHVIIATLGTYSLVGIAAILSRQVNLVAALGTYSLAGIAVTLIYSGGVDETLTADVGTYALTGVVVTLTRNVPLVAALGTYALTGIAVTFTRDVLLVAELSVYTLTGFPTIILRNHVPLTADLGTYALAGIATTLTRNVNIVGDVGTYSTINQLNKISLESLNTISLATVNEIVVLSNLIDANLLWGHKTIAALGTYTLAGIDTILRAGFTLVAALGTYSLAGIAITIVEGHKLIADTALYVLTGIGADLIWSNDKQVMLFPPSRPFSVVLTDRTTGTKYDIDRTPGDFVKLTVYTQQFGERKYDPFPAFSEPHINPPGLRVFVDSGVFSYESVVDDQRFSAPINNPTVFRENVHQLTTPVDFKIGDKLVWEKVL